MRKVLIISNDLEMGGIQKSLIDFLHFLSKKEFRLDVLLWEKEGVLKSQIPTSVNIIERKYPKTWNEIKKEKNVLSKIQYFFNYLKFNFYSKILKKPWLYFAKISETYDFAISYSQNGFPRFFAIDKVKSKKKYLWFHHGSYDFKGKEYDLDKKYFAKFNQLITVSDANKTMLLKHFPDLEDKISVVPNIINVEKIISDAKELVLDFPKIEGVYNFVTVSRFSKEKGINLAVDIATELRNQGLKFKWYFIGEGKTFLEIKKLVAERDLKDVCILLGTKENPYPYMKLADFYIQTSFVESQSITIYEALALKKLIFTTDLPALNDALENGNLGVLCKAEKMDFVNKITHLLNNDLLKNNLLETVEKHEVKNEIAFNKLNELFEI
ncbi:Glycosyltransferase involved in cell wall bisynthesis [Halpernia humi]|uniref:Glycosyltransferase involved in cell wall bisynthesis n=1 Tax=Halpernia humi TaxID=493375 RepID=A0A1H6AQA6_9FLAO|nr:glycosyltransferase [Halpernia humi]SEG50247.1 Glycosyltransferase involved in cell wall bisynthesis [Halpernia humi]